MQAPTQDQIGRLAKELANAGQDAFFAWSPVAMGYLHGFREGAGERFMTLAIHADGRAAMICPALSATQAKRSGIQDVRPWRDGEDPISLFRSLAQEWDISGGILSVDDEMPAHMVLSMQSALPAALFKAGGTVLAGLMRCKSYGELELMRKAGMIADRALAAGLSAIKDGATEIQVAAALKSEMSRLGGVPTFAIVATGANGAEPHHESDDTPIRRGDVIILDFGCDFGGYQSDITRTVAFGHADPDAVAVYDIVLRAHKAARQAIRPGATAGSIDEAARKVIEHAGYGEQFMHRTGHGIGMKVHEEPFIIAGSEVQVEPGHCFSIEPGIYLPGRFGIRIENIVSVSDNGHTSLNDEPGSTLLVVG